MPGRHQKRRRLEHVWAPDRRERVAQVVAASGDDGARREERAERGDAARGARSQTAALQVQVRPREGHDANSGRSDSAGDPDLVGLRLRAEADDVAGSDPADRQGPRSDMAQQGLYRERAWIQRLVEVEIEREVALPPESHE